MKFRIDELGEDRRTWRCGHEWVPLHVRSEERPRVCPSCKSPNWDRPYRFRRVDGKRVAAGDAREAGLLTSEP